MSKLEYLVTWLIKLRVRLSLLFKPLGHCGRIMEITPWRDVLVVRAEYGVYVISDHRNYLSEWEINAINNNRYK